MRLHIEDNELRAGRKGREDAHPDKAARVLSAKGYRFAAAIAHGELSTPTRAKAIGRAAKLLCVDEAIILAGRERGLLR